MSQPPANDELRALLDAGRRGVVLVPGEARGRLEQRIGALAGWPATGAPRPTSATGGGGSVLHGVKVATVAKAALLFLAGAGAGLATKDHIWPPAPRVETRYVDRVVEVERPVPVPASPSALASASAAPSAPSVLVPAAPARPSAESSASGRDEALARERTMIETARSALARGDASGALAVLSQHAAAFPRGQLAETREALAIQALSRLGRADEARARAERFRRDYPSSVYQTVVDEAARTISP